MPAPPTKKKRRSFRRKLSLGEAVAQFEEKAGYLKDFRLRKFLETTRPVVAWNTINESFGENHAMPDLEMILAYASIVRYFRIQRDGFLFRVYGKVLQRPREPHSPSPVRRGVQPGTFLTF